MAKGDVASLIEDVVADGAVVYQPAAGVEVVVKTALTASVADDMLVQLYNGTLITMYGPVRSSWGGSLFVNNTNYLRLHNGNAAAKVLGATGVQVK